MHACNWHKPVLEHLLAFIINTMRKTYHSSTEISINVSVGDNTIHLAFVPLTLGGSTFTTSDANMQQAIEGHRFFGTRIKLMAAESEERQVDEHPAERHDDMPVVISFSSMADAKDYCADTFGISRTRLRSRAQIIQLAAEKGYVLDINSPQSHDP